MNKPIWKMRQYFMNHTSGFLFTILRFFFRIYKHICSLPEILSYYRFRSLPLEDKIVATAFAGEIYGDNPKYIIEEVHRLRPETTLVWLTRKDRSIELPDYVQQVDIDSKKEKARAYATAKIWIDSHRLKTVTRKRKGQVFIETWHGGLGIKKLDADVPRFQQIYDLMREVKHTSDLADLFLSNSKHLTDIYRSAFRYRGKIWRSGYPKNDVLLTDREPYRKKVKDFYSLGPNKILLYAPTFREHFVDEETIDFRVYDIDYERLRAALSERFGGEWSILVRLHPFLRSILSESAFSDSVTDATDYPGIQDLIMASDILISDYSSCLFDAAISGIPCFTFAVDFETYRNDRGVYYEMDELPFPYSSNNDELMQQIKCFDSEDYKQRWEQFAKKTGLYETGHAAKDIASVLTEFLDGNEEPFRSVKNDIGALLPDHLQATD